MTETSWRGPWVRSYDRNRRWFKIRHYRYVGPVRVRVPWLVWELFH